MNRLVQVFLLAMTISTGASASANSSAPSALELAAQSLALAATDYQPAHYRTSRSHRTHRSHRNRYHRYGAGRYRYHQRYHRGHRHSYRNRGYNGRYGYRSPRYYRY